MYELSKQFTFDAAHTLHRKIAIDASKRIHGHSYRAEVTLRGMPDATTGMIIDFGILAQALEDARQSLDHHFLDNVENLGPATLENLCLWIWNRLAPKLHGLSKVTVSRDNGANACSYYGESKQSA